MSRRAARIGKWLAAGILLLIAVGIWAPYQRADIFAPEIRRGLEQSLGRKIEFDQVHFNLFTGPGFSLTKVQIYEDARLGLEPLAYVESLEARPRLLALLKGRVEFASIRLEDASVNLAKVEMPDGSTAWNVLPLLDQNLFTALPEIHLRSGRINFKSGDTKSTFYITRADLDIRPPLRPGGDLRIEFNGEPARTDRPARGFGSLTARGRWQPDAQGGKLDLQLELEKSAVNDMASLILGRDYDVHGSVSSRLRLAGGPADLKLTGNLRIEDIHRWDLEPDRNQNWPLVLDGHLDLRRQRFDLAAHSLEKESPAFTVRLHATDYLMRPRWGAMFSWNRLRTAPLLQLARHLGAPVPTDLRVDGVLDGAIGYSVPSGFSGSLAFHDASLAIAESPLLRFQTAQLLVETGRIHLARAEVRTSNDDLATVEADYQWSAQALDLAISTDGMHVAGLRSQVALAAVPMLEQVESGVWQGKLRYQRDGEGTGVWSGSFRVNDAKIGLPGMADPLLIASAQARLEGQKLIVRQIQAGVGPVDVHGEYRYEPGAPRPHRFRLQVPSLAVTELERQLAPTLSRTRGLIARALSFGRAPLPGWLRDRHLDGTVEIGELDAAGYRWEKLHGRVIWDGPHVELSDLGGRLLDGNFLGRVSAELSAGEPVYRLIARLNAIDWNGGKLDAEFSMDTQGTGPALLSNLSSEGSFSGQAFDTEPLDQFETVAGCFLFAFTSGAPKLRLTDLRLASGKELFIGQGSTQDDGRLLVQLSSPSRQLSVSGSLAQLRLDELPRQ